MDLREYRSGDVEAMFRLDEVCFPEPYRFDRITMREFAEARSAIVAIVEDKAKHEMAGFLILHIEEALLERREAEPCGYIVTIDVAPGLRRTGIATEMMNYVERKARAAGVNSVALHVAIDNGGAVAFYERSGYRCLGVAPHFYREAGVDALVFSKAI